MRLGTLYNTHRTEITQSIRDVLNNALLHRTPERYTQLLQNIRNFIAHPSEAQLVTIKSLLDQLTEAEIRRLMPAMSTADVQNLVTLRAFLNAPYDSVAITTRFGTAETALVALLNHEGVITELMHTFTQNLADPNGPLQVLRRSLNSRAEVSLRESKTAMEAYRARSSRQC